MLLLSIGKWINMRINMRVLVVRTMFRNIK